MKLKINELQGPALDWAVGKCDGREPSYYKGRMCATAHSDFPDSPPIFGPELNYSTDWAQGGPIIEREKIAIDWDHDCWNASTDSHPAYYSAETPLVAAMRCYVASKFGDEVEVPDEILGTMAGF